MLLAVACSTVAPPTTLMTSFADARGLEVGAPVVLEGVTVGEVGAVSAGAGRAEVHLVLDRDRGKAVRRGALALIARGANGARVELYNESASAEPVADGATLRGLDSALELALWRSGSFAESAGAIIETATRAAREYLDSEQWWRTRRELEQSLADVENRYRETLEQAGDALDVALKELPLVIERLRRQGAEEAARLLERWREELERGGPLPGPGAVPETDPRPV